MCVCVSFYIRYKENEKIHHQLDVLIWNFFSLPNIQQVNMNELDALRQEAETLKNAIRVSIETFLLFLFLVIFIF